MNSQNKELKRISSFEVNHNTLKRGVYISRQDGDITTYDIRMKIPNGGDYLETPAMHTIEHIFATFARNSEWASEIIYFGPMGCRTGFYFLLRNVSDDAALELIKRAFRFIAGFEGEIPGVSAIECGNYLEHNPEKAKAEAEEMCKILSDYTTDRMIYS